MQAKMICEFAMQNETCQTETKKKELRMKDTEKSQRFVILCVTNDDGKNAIQNIHSFHVRAHIKSK